MKASKLALGLIVASLAVAPTLLKAQDESVADAARRAQAEKKATLKPAVVYSNDNLDTIKGNISVVGPAPVAPAPIAEKGKVVTPPEKDKADKDKTDAATDAAKGDATKTDAAADKPAGGQNEADWRKKFADARRTLTDDSHELDIAQRELGLKTQQYYSDPNVAMKEQFTNDDINKSKKEIEDTTAAVAKDKQAISDLEDALRRAGGDPGWAREQ